MAVELSLCRVCASAYGRRAICSGCLRAADSDAMRKRAILLPLEFAD